jgi:hypothetical protein
MTFDHNQGRLYAAEMLDDRGVSNMDKLVSGLAGEKWRQTTAQNLINAAVMRMAEGINPEYQRGVIEKAGEYLK